MPETPTTETDLERAARVRETWFVERPDTDQLVLLAAGMPGANVTWICSCGAHGTIATTDRGFAREVCQNHLRGHVVPADPFDGIAS